MTACSTLFTTINHREQACYFNAPKKCSAIKKLALNVLKAFQKF